jgi:ribose 5-phosphate isomerase B
MKIYLGADHAGFELKEKIKVYLEELGLNYEVQDFGAFNLVEDDDYPDYVKKVAEAVAENYELEERRGIILGGSGQGEAICANRFSGIRAVVFYGQQEPVLPINAEGKKSVDSFEIIKLAREHNNANILSLGSRFVTEDEAKFSIELFLNTKFSKEERHIRRIKKIEPEA